MLLELKRRPSDDKCTIGDLFINRVWFCNTLEDIIRAHGVKVDGQTAIPPGEYIIELDFSQRFQKVMPHILQVPMFEGIRIHPLNWAQETEGCVGVGLTDAEHPDMILHSKDTFAKLMPLLESAFGREIICISIINP
jgi:hypothetical protein